MQNQPQTSLNTNPMDIQQLQQMQQTLHQHMPQHTPHQMHSGQHAPSPQSSSAPPVAPAAPVHNPLIKNFRKPEIYIKLISNGRWWAPGSLDMPMNEELPVYPMTARDEIALKTPDALMNGSSVVEVIQSCCPNIKNAWNMPSIDVDAVLIAIRIASYGHIMDVGGVCPHCDTSNEYSVNLHDIIGQLSCPDYDTPVYVDGLQVYLQPQAYFLTDKVNQIEFEYQKVLAQLDDPNIPNLQKRSIVADTLKRLNDWSFDSLVDSTYCIVNEEGIVVDNRDFIREFYDNASGTVMAQIKDHLAKITKSVSIKPIDVMCESESCQKQYKITLNFNHSSFFGKGF